MSYSTEGIAHVRVRPLALDVGAEGAAVAPDAVEVMWDSTQEGRWHQVYVNGQLAGVTAKPEDRRLAVSAPVRSQDPLRVGPNRPAQMLLVEVVAVEAADRWTDFGSLLSGFGEDAGAQVRLTWQAGEYLDPNLESFDVFSDGRTGTVDYNTPLNESPIPAKPGGLAPWGYGCGGYGVGGYGQAAAMYEWTTELLEPGTWRLAVVAVDAARNRLASAAEVQITVAPLPPPPDDFRVTAYDTQTQIATLGWEASSGL